MRHSTLLTVLPCLVLAITACEVSEVESSQNTNATSIATASTPPQHGGEASLQMALGNAAGIVGGPRRGNDGEL